MRQVRTFSETVEPQSLPVCIMFVSVCTEKFHDEKINNHISFRITIIIELILSNTKKQKEKNKRLFKQHQQKKKQKQQQGNEENIDFIFEGKVDFVWNHILTRTLLD